MPNGTRSAALPKPKASTLTAEFVEAESGKGADALDRRPQLAAALAAARSREVRRSSSPSSIGSPAMSPSSPA